MWSILSSDSLSESFQDWQRKWMSTPQEQGASIPRKDRIYSLYGSHWLCGHQGHRWSHQRGSGFPMPRDGFHQVRAHWAWFAGILRTIPFRLYLAWVLGRACSKVCRSESDLHRWFGISQHEGIRTTFFLCPEAGTGSWDSYHSHLHSMPPSSALTDISSAFGKAIIVSSNVFSDTPPPTFPNSRAHPGQNEGTLQKTFPVRARLSSNVRIQQTCFSQAPSEPSLRVLGRWSWWKWSQ